MSLIESYMPQKKRQIQRIGNAAVEGGIVPADNLGIQAVPQLAWQTWLLFILVTTISFILRCKPKQRHALGLGYQDYHYKPLISL